jgi:alkylation response protein AidB-like acyl-CoA dehydrogenase
MTSQADTDTRTWVPSLLYSETEEDLRKVVRSVIDDICPWTAVVERLDQGQAHDPRLWRTCAETGIPALLIPERLGGAGASALEMAVALEEIGRACLPVPLLTSSVVATVALLATGSAGEPWLRELASGDAIAGVLVSSGQRPDQWPAAANLVASTNVNGSFTVTGRIHAVVGAEAARYLMVPAVDEGTPVLAVVDAEDAAVLVQVVCSLDETRPLATVELRAAPATVIARGAAASDALRSGLVAGAALLASEQLGTAERALELACDQLRTRRQFGRLLGSFQALRHRAADLWTDITGARAVARYAAATLAENALDTELAAHLAQAVCADVALQTAEACLQMMGGIGFTWEHPTQLPLKRAAAGHALFGTPEQHRQRIAELRGIASAPAL